MPLGVAPVGFGTGEDAPEPPAGNWGSRFIDSTTGDYAVDPVTRQLQQMPSVRQRFLLRLSTKQRSSTVRPNDGIELPTKIDAASTRNVDDAVRNAMRQETDVEKVARIISVTPTRDPNNSGKINTVVAFEDLTTGQTPEPVVL